MPFVVLENSSGTGKTQMAFNLQANGAVDVFYLPCTPSKDVSQEVYQAFMSRQIAFQDCIESDMANMEGDGSVYDFRRVGDTKRLKVHAFIIAAIRGANTFRGDALLKDIIAARDRRSKPIVFFLDEFPRLGNHLTGNDHNARKKLVRSMRNVFRFLRLPLIISATNGTARNLFTVSDYSRPSSGDPVPWCVVVPSLPMFATKGSATSVFKWIIRHSRPLFGALAQKYMDQFPYDGQDQLGYLTNMVKALTPEFRCLKLTKREDDFEKGQLYLFLEASYNVDDERTGPSEDTHPLGVEDKNWGMSDDENDEDYVPEDDDSDDEVSLMSRALPTQRTDPPPVRDLWMPTDAEIQSWLGASCPPNPILLYFVNSIIDDNVAKNIGFESQTQRQKYYIGLFHELRHFSAKKSSRKSKVPEWQALCQSWNVFVVNFNKDPKWYRERIASARERYYTYTVCGKCERLHDQSMEVEIPCAVPLARSARVAYQVQRASPNVASRGTRIIVYPITSRSSVLVSSHAKLRVLRLAAALVQGLALQVMVAFIRPHHFRNDLH
ncbi:hypothetical protein V7S43_015963 [Phytophthora oleae]|uniref:AAA+ ATPase domain-containing protein n=1 Tax=Phytophthora oleae TaxID=2107226 RepID=A0ABD3F0V2_9STRA